VPDEGVAAEAALADYDWALLRTRCREAWALEPAERGAVKGRGIVIGQPDTGYTDHPELEHGALDRLRDFDVLKGLPDAHAVLRGVPPLAFPSHGTSTASVVASREAGDVTGAAPESVVVPIRAATTVIHLHNGDLAVAIDYARELKVDVISISMGGIAYPRALRTSIQRAVRDGIIVMAAAGQPLPLVVAPASLPECLAVGGTRRDDQPWTLSARGQEVDWSAPAKQVWVAATENEGPLPFKVAEHSGTSFAVALSAGIAALWLAHHGRETIRSTYGDENVQAAFRSLVRQTARRPDGWDEQEHGAGIIDAAALLSADLGSADTSPPPPPPAPDTTEWLLGRLAGIVGRPEPQMRERLGTLAGGELERLAPFAGEIAYRAAENEELREELARAPGATEAAGADPARIRLAALASPSLRAALG
jgi:subtilisin family serine protease